MLCHDSSKSGIWAPDKCSTSCWAAWCNFNVKVPFRDWMYFWSQTFKVWTELKLFLLPSLLLPITHSPSSFSLSLSLPPSSPSLYLSPSLLLPITLSPSLLLQITFSLSLPSSPHLSLSLSLSESLSLPVFYPFLPSVSSDVPLIAVVVVSVSLLAAALMIIVMIWKKRTSECVTCNTMNN